MSTCDDPNGELTTVKRVTLSDRDEVQKIIASLSLAAPVHNVDPASVSIYRLDGYATEWARRKQIYNTLHHFPVKQLGTSFLVIVSRDLVGVIMEVVRFMLEILRLPGFIDANVAGKVSRSSAPTFAMALHDSRHRT